MSLEHSLNKPSFLRSGRQVCFFLKASFELHPTGTGRLFQSGCSVRIIMLWLQRNCCCFLLDAWDVKTSVSLRLLLHNRSKFSVSVHAVFTGFRLWLVKTQPIHAHPVSAFNHHHNNNNSYITPNPARLAQSTSQFKTRMDIRINTWNMHTPGVSLYPHMVSCQAGTGQRHRRYTSCQ